MRICVTCVYWTLLFISVASSALLFIIVASENAQSNYYASFKKNQTLETYDNGLDSIESDDLESSTIAIVKLQDPRKLQTNYKDHYYQDQFPGEPINFETVINGEAKSKENSYKNPYIVAESLSQQPNLSQGVSETEQAAVLTLGGDTAAAELQNLVEPRLSPEFSRARLFAKNSSLFTENVNVDQETIKEQQEISPSTQIPTLPIIDEIAKKLNETSFLEVEPLVLQNIDEEKVGELEDVLVVRAEQGLIITDESEFSLEDEIVKVLSDETPKVDDVYTTGFELSDTEAKGQLVEHTKDDAAAVVLSDGIVSAGSTDPHEDIPSFNEWTQKRLEEAEKKKMHPNASAQNSGVPARGVSGIKVRSKNYASPDCGAKVVAANPEARSARSVLVSTRDEYMLNTCTSRIWFVVELCEAIQAKKIELANFELFSSSPKDFSVYISDRFPMRDWSLVGQFTAKDIKDTQSFILQPHLFGKFIKVELHTYYGSEHFCPISLFRAYGTSEFEVLETETENQISRETIANVDETEDSDEEVLDVENGEPPRNLFGSARDAVLNIVKKAAEVLVKSSELTGNNITKIQQSIDGGNIFENSFVSCMTPRYTILCDNCSDQKLARIFQLVSCREQQLNQLLKIDLVNRTLQQSELCKSYGVKIETIAEKTRKPELEKLKSAVEQYVQSRGKNASTKNFQLRFLTSVFHPDYIAALCNVLAMKERKMVMNTSHEVSISNSKDTAKEDVSPKSSKDYSNAATKSFQHVSASYASTSSADSFKSMSSQEFQRNSHDTSSEELDKVTTVSIETSLNAENLALHIKTSKTLEKEIVRNDSSTPILESSKDSIEETIQAELLTTAPVFLNIDQHPILKPSVEPPIIPDTSIENSHQMTISSPAVTIDSNEVANDDMISDIDPLEFAGIQSKVEKMEQCDQEGKHGQAEIVEHEIKLSSQDSLALDSLLSDLKDLEGETINIQNEPAASASITQSTPNIMPQKESVFLRLSNRIKALERNMSLSGQYLEELSQRYKKQVEEMQRSLERTVAAMNEETRKREERESKRAEEIAMLREDIASLSKSVESLLYDRDSWHGKFLLICQHHLLIFSEVFVIFLILLYYRRTKQSDVNEKQQLEKDVLRRKSAENFSSHMKKTKKRRPSEIASHISGTYRDLMIDDRSYETKREKRKKRKKENTLSAIKANSRNDIKRNSITHCRSVLNTSTDDVEVTYRSTPSVEMLEAIDSPIYISRRPKSNPENTTDWFNNCDHVTECNVPLTSLRNEHVEMESVNSFDFSNSRIEDISESNSLSKNTSPKIVISNERTATEFSTDILNPKNSNVILKDIKLSTSSFMKTALSTRKKRKVQSNDVNGKWSDFTQQKQTSDDSYKSVRSTFITSELFPEKIYNDSNTTTNGLLVDQSDESRSSNIISVSKKMDRRSTGFKKMVRKFF